MNVVVILQSQKVLGDKIEAKAKAFTEAPIERKTYTLIVQKKKELNELIGQFQANHAKLSVSQDIGKDHEYYKFGYATKIELVAKDYMNDLEETQSFLEAANPDLRKKYTATGAEQDEGRRRGVSINLDNLFKVAGATTVDSENVSVGSAGTANKTVHKLIATVTQDIAELNMAITDERPENEIKIKRATILGNWSRIQSTQEEIIMNPNYDIDPFLALQKEMVPILIQACDDPIVATQNNGGHGHRNTMKESSATLPKLTIPVFNGDYVQFKSFKELFGRMVGNKAELDDCEKLAYLRGQVKGEAAALISSLPLENTSYKLAWEILEKRYENDHILVSKLFEKLLKGPVMKRHSMASTKEVADSIREAVNVYSNLGYKLDKTSDTMLYYVIEGRIDTFTMAQYESTLRTAGEARTYSHMMEFLENRIRTMTPRVATENQAPQKRNMRYKDFKQESSNSRESTTLVTSGAQEVNQQAMCGCNKAHELPNCPKFKELDTLGKQKKVKELKLCNKCLKPNHIWKQCSAEKCKKCKKNHHTMLHIDNFGKAAKSLIGSTFGNANIDHVFLATAIIEINNKNGKPIRARALLDSGSQLNIITQNLFNKLGLKCSQTSLKVSGIGAAKVESRKRTNIVIKSVVSGFMANLEAFVMKQITNCQPNKEIDIQKWAIPKNITLADPKFNVPAGIEIIICGEIFYKLLSIEMISLGEALPDMQNTVFGWVVTGKLLGLNQEEAFIGMLTETPLEEKLSKFWELEDRYQAEKPMIQLERKCEEYFDRTTMRESAKGKFIVNLQFLTEPSALEEIGITAIPSSGTKV